MRVIGGEDAAVSPRRDGAPVCALTAQEGEARGAAAVNRGGERRLTAWLHVACRGRVIVRD